MASLGGDQQQQQQHENDVGETDDEYPPPKPTAAEVEACQFSSWYSTFRNMDTTAIKDVNITNKKARKNVTFESIIIRPLPEEFIEYLMSDGVRLPECASKVSSCMNDNNNSGKDNDDRWDTSSDEEEDEENDGSNSNSNEKPKKYNFPTLTEKIQSAITTLGGGSGGGCMPKLNWSSPKDATWMNCGTLKCTKAGDVYLLLKSSDFVGFDLEKAWDDLSIVADSDSTGEKMSNLSIANEETTNSNNNGLDDDGKQSANNTTNEMENVSPRSAKPHGFEYELVLRKWCNLHPSMEFRCFVYKHELVAISQRHPSKFYPHLQPPSDGSIHPSTIILHAFFETYIRNRFAKGSQCQSHRYVIDLYLDSQERVWIVDFNVWGDRTDALLFDWKELMPLGSQVVVIDSNQAVIGDDDEPEMIPTMPEMRVVTKDMKSMTYDPLSSYRGPTDVMDLVGSGSGDAGMVDSDGKINPSFQDFMKQCVRPSEM